MNFCLVLFFQWFVMQPIAAQVNTPSEASIFRLLPEIQSFSQWDSENSAPESAVLFVGSSSINYWKTKTAFPDIAVINRGFGGATAPDIWHFYDQLITPYKPRLIVLFVGTNDIAAGYSPEQIAENIRSLISRMLVDLPNTKVIYLAISPTQLRWHSWHKSARVNKSIENFASETQRVRFLDTASALLTESGQPNRQLFLDDGLHLNQQGYAIWEHLLAPYLKP